MAKAKLDTPWMRTGDISKFLKCSEGYLHKGRIDGYGPPFMKLGKAIRYNIEDVKKWTQAQLHQSTAEYTAGTLSSRPISEIETTQSRGRAKRKTRKS